MIIFKICVDIHIYGGGYYMCIHVYADNFRIKILLFSLFEYFEYVYFILLGLLCVTKVIIFFDLAKTQQRCM